MTITVPKNLLKAAFLFASKDSSRYILNTVQFLKRTTGVLITACDGRRILTIKSTETLMADADQVIIPRFRVPNRKSGVHSDLDCVEITSEKVRGRTVYVCDDVVIPEVTGEYPKWQTVFHGVKPVPMNHSSVNATYLTDFGKAAELIDGDPHIYLQTLEGGAVIIKGASDTSYTSWRGMFMPLRAIEESPNVPEWISDL